MNIQPFLAMPKHTLNPDPLPTHDELVRLATAAILYQENDSKQNALMRHFDISQSSASRLIARAIELGLVSIKVELSRKPAHRSLFDEARQLSLNDGGLHETANAWSKPTGVTVREVRTFPTELERFCSAVAAPVGQLFEQSKLGIGISLGRTIANVIREMPRTGVRISHPVKVVPLSGDPVHLINLNYQQQTASLLAGELVQRAFAPGSSSEQPVLTGVPCYLPIRFQGQGKKNSPVEEYLNAIPGFQKVFGGTQHNDNFLRQVDTALVGVGVITDNDKDNTQDLQTGVFIREIILAEQRESAKSELERIIDGELGGVLLPKPRLSDSDRLLLAGYKRGWLGIQENELRSLAQSASTNGQPGVILVARGAAKAEAVRAATKLGLINVLFVDLALAAALKKLA